MSSFIRYLLVIFMASLFINPSFAASKTHEHEVTAKQQQTVGSEKININTATVAELDQLKGIGPKKAQAIVDYRNEHGKFSSLEDLQKVKGIHEKLTDRFKDQVSFE